MKIITLLRGSGSADIKALRQLQCSHRSSSGPFKSAPDGFASVHAKIPLLKGGEK